MIFHTAEILAHPEVSQSSTSQYISAEIPLNKTIIFSQKQKKIVKSGMEIYQRWMLKSFGKCIIN